tara:strand:- start:89 stop:403 length:315 start_codon:yes stop_codon:yes gene_type:complete
MNNQISRNRVTFQTTSSSKIECIKDDLTSQWFVEYTYKPMSKLEASSNGSWEFPTYQYAEFRNSVSTARHMWQRFDQLRNAGRLERVLTTEELEQKLIDVVFNQ